MLNSKKFLRPATWILLLSIFIFSTLSALGGRGGGGGGGGRGGGGGMGGGRAGGGFQGRMGQPGIGPRSGMNRPGQFNRGYGYNRFGPYGLYAPYGYYDSGPSIYYDDYDFSPPMYPMPAPPPPMPSAPPMILQPQQPRQAPVKQEPLPTYKPPEKPDIIVYPPSPSGSTAMPKESSPRRDTDLVRTIFFKISIGGMTVPLEVSVDDIYARKVMKVDRGQDKVYYIVPCNEDIQPETNPTGGAGHWQWVESLPDQVCGYWLWVVE